MRIVTLLPSATEIVYALGLEPVGVSHECDYPPEAVGKPAVNQCRIDPDAGSGAIHEQVLQAQRDHGGVYEIDLRALEDADPDLIITQAICDVCAVDQVLVEEAVGELNLDAEILTTDPHSLDDVLADIRRIGAATGAMDPADELVTELTERIADINSTATDISQTPRVLLLDWMDPVMVAGHWIPEMVEMVGGQYGLTDPGARSVPTNWPRVLEFDPQVLITAPCGFSLEQTVANSDDLTTCDGWETIAAVESGRVFAMDGHDYFNRPGPRLVDSLEYLAGVVHPDLFEMPPVDVHSPITTPHPA